MIDIIMIIVTDIWTIPEADPGFPVDGGANRPGRGGGGAPTNEFAKFSEKLHEFYKISGCSRRGAPGAPSL